MGRFFGSLQAWVLVCGIAATVAAPRLAGATDPAHRASSQDHVAAIRRGYLSPSVRVQQTRLDRLLRRARVGRPEHTAYRMPVAAARALQRYEHESAQHLANAVPDAVLAARQPNRDGYVSVPANEVGLATAKLPTRPLSPRERRQVLRAFGSTRGERWAGVSRGAQSRAQQREAAQRLDQGQSLLFAPNPRADFRIQPTAR